MTVCFLPTIELCEGASDIGFVSVRGGIHFAVVALPHSTEVRRIRYCPTCTYMHTTINWPNLVNAIFGLVGTQITFVSIDTVLKLVSSA